MNWKFISPIQQEDTVGNIIQQRGGVIPKACQQCKKKFDNKPTPVIQKQYVPIYICALCNFQATTGEEALDHKIETDHSIEKTKRERIIGSINQLVGVIPIITKTENDCIILCGDCHEKSKK